MTAKVYEFEDVRVDTRQFQVSKAGQPVDLEPKAIDVLVFLLERPGQLVRKDELLDAIWRDTFVTPNALTRVIAQLRKALDDDAQEARIIETVPKRGYRFLPPVALTEAARPPAPVVPAAPAAGVRPSSRAGRLVLTAAALVAVATAAGWTWMRSPARHSSPAFDELMQLTAAPGYEADPAISADGARLAYTSDETGANEIFVRPIGDGGALQLTRDGAQNSSPAWSPDGAHLAYRSTVKRGIWIVSSLGGSGRQIVPRGSDPAWSPDGSTIAVSTWEGALAERSSIMAVGVADGTTRPITQPGAPPGGHRHPTWSPGGDRIAFWSFDGARGGSIWIVGAAGGAPVRLVDQAYATGLAFTPDGALVCWSGFGPRSSPGVWCVPTSRSVPGAPIPMLQGLAGITGLAVAANGTVAYAVSQLDSDLWTVPPRASGGTDNDRTAGPLFEDTWRNSHAAFSPDGQWLAYLNWRPGSPSDLWLLDMTTMKSEVLVPGKDPEFYPTWMPDSRHLLVASGRGKNRLIMRVSIETRRSDAVTGLPELMANFSLSPDGRDLAYHVATESGRLDLWRVPMGGGDPVRLSPPEISAGYPAWAPDGRRLAIEVEEDGGTHVYVIDRDGKHRTKVTSGSGQNWPHSWAPDNDGIAVAGERNGIWNLWTISAETGTARQLTTFTQPNAYVRYPAWSPLNDRIVFERGRTTANIWTGRLRQ